MIANARPASYRQDFERDGYVIAPGLYPPDEMLAWKSALKRVLESMKTDNASGVHVWFDASLPEPVLSAMSDSKVTPILRNIIGPNVEFLSAKAVFKDGKTRFPSPFHQDRFYWNGSVKTSVWIALDDATVDNGCLIFVPGTHRRTFDMQVVQSKAGFNNRVKDEDLSNLEKRSIVCKRGDAVFFHDLLVHGSHPNQVGGDRWSVISTYRDASVHDSSTVWKHSLVVCGTSVNPGAVTRTA